MSGSTVTVTTVWRVLQDRVAAVVHRSSPWWGVAVAAVALGVIEVVCAYLGVRGPAVTLVRTYSREEPAAPAFYCALALALVLAPRRLRWPTLGAAIVVDLGFALERLLVHGRVTSFGNGALVALTVLTAYSVVRVRAPLRYDAVRGLACAWSFVAATTVGNVWLQVTAQAEPEVLDEYAALADRALGSPSWAVGQVFDVLGPVGRAPFLAVYAMLPVAAVLVALVQLRGGWARHNVVLAFVVVGAIGPLVYLLFPVVGPAFAFGPEGGSFAVSTGWPGQPLIPANPRPVSFDAVTPRNAVPSLHTAWAVVLFLHTRAMARWLRIMGAAWLVVTLLATLGFGYHYGVDLVVGAVFALTVEAAVRSHRTGWRREGAVLVGAGATVFLAVLLAVRYGAATIADHPWSSVVLALSTLGALGWEFRRVFAAQLSSGRNRRGWRHKPARRGAVLPGDGNVARTPDAFGSYGIDSSTRPAGRPVSSNRWAAATRSNGSTSPTGTLSAPCAAAAVRSRAAACLTSAGKSSLPSSRTTTLAKSIGQNGRVGRLSRVANAAITAPFAAIRASRSTSAENETPTTRSTPSGASSPIVVAGSSSSATTWSARV